MIFVTVGTHEQGMDRLLMKIDMLIENHYIKEEVFAQIGYSSYKPQHYKYGKLISYADMEKYVKESRIIITHGGPGSIFLPLKYNKIPIVVPRNPKFNEHVDNHQILFTKRLDKEKRIIAVYEIDKLEYCIEHYDQLVDKCINRSTNIDKFIDKFEIEINNIMQNKR